MQKRFVFLPAVPPTAELHSSRTKERWSPMPHVAARAPEGWRVSHAPEASVPEDPGFEPLDGGEEVTVDARKRAWARLLAGPTLVGRVLRSIRSPTLIADLSLGTHWIFWSESEEVSAEWPGDQYAEPIYRPWTLELGIVYRPPLRR